MTEQIRRATRLMRIEQLLRRRGRMSASELARETGYSQRTINRDIAALESELAVPLVFEGRKYSIMAGSDHPLSPVRFTLQEARSVYLAARLFARSADESDPDAISALEKVADTLPASMAQQARASIGELRERPADDRQVEVMRALTEGWAHSRTVTISYLSSRAESPYETEVEPYLLEPSTAGSYVVGASSLHGAVRVFKLDRIQSAAVTDAAFATADVEEITRRLRRSWGGVVFGDEEYRAVVDFTAQVARRISETYWHPSQELTPLDDGGVRLTVVLPSFLEFVPWVLGWGAEARVVGPDELTSQVATALRAAANRYPTEP